MFFRRLSALFVPVLLLSAMHTAGQTAPTPPMNDEILNNAEKQAQAYAEAFKNLLTDETKTFELLGPDGGVRKRRVVASNFLVYPLSRNADQIVEFRNVLAVDGKPVDDRDKRAENLFKKVMSAESSDKEFKRLRDESSRYDLEISISGMTLFEALAVRSSLRPFFEYDIHLAELPDGGQVYRVIYRQVKDSPDITVNADRERPIDRPGLNYEVDVDRDVPLNARLRGTLYVDAQTFRLWREDREITIQPAGFEAPMTVIEGHFTFQMSDFDILTPAVITHTQYRASIKKLQAEKEAVVTFKYGNFSRPAVAVKSSEVKPN